MNFRRDSIASAELARDLRLRHADRLMPQPELPIGRSANRFHSIERSVAAKRNSSARDRRSRRTARPSSPEGRDL